MKSCNIEIHITNRPATMRLYDVNESFGCMMVKHFVNQHGLELAERVVFPVDAEEAHFNTKCGECVTVIYF